MISDIDKVDTGDTPGVSSAILDTKHGSAAGSVPRTSLLPPVAGLSTTPRNVSPLGEGNINDDTAPPEEQISARGTIVDHGSSRRAAGAPPRKRRAVDDLGISIQPSNPKRSGSKSHARYESYKEATTRAQFSALGGSSADYAHDLSKGYITLLSS